MKILEKIKTMFTEEVEEVETVKEPIKKDVIKVEIPAPESKEEPKTKEATPEEKFVFPVYFDDKDFKELEKPKPIKKEEPKTYGGITPSTVTKQEIKKQFKPTPIISPVYGVLDKNYHKEDIVHKTPKLAYVGESNMTVDDIRKKAYGTLEDELENTLTRTTIIREEINLPEDVDMFEELEEKVNQIEDEISTETPTPSRMDVYGDMIEDELNNEASSDQKLSESDLFNLIDSMYEKGSKNDN